MTLYYHVINRLCDLDNNPVLEPTTLSSLVAIAPAEIMMKGILPVMW